MGLLSRLLERCLRCFRCLFWAGELLPVFGHCPPNPPGAMLLPIVDNESIFWAPVKPAGFNKGGDWANWGFWNFKPCQKVFVGVTAADGPILGVDGGE